MRRLCIVALFGAWVTSAQTVDATRLAGPINLGGNWLYHSGDDSRWSRPDIAETDWRVVSTNASWYAHNDMWKGYFWYRRHITIAPSHPPLALLIEFMGNPYQVFVNGTSLGAFGQFPPNLKLMFPLPREFTIPLASVRGDSAVVAIRFYSPAALNGQWGGLRSSAPLFLGTAEQIRVKLRLQNSQVFYQWVPDLFVRFVSLLLAIGLLILFWWQRQFPEYVWIAAYFFAMTAWTVFRDYRDVAPIGLEQRSFFENGLTILAQVVLLQFVFVFLKQRMPIWLRVYQLSLFLQLVLIALAFAEIVPEPPLDLVGLIWEMPYVFLLPAVVFWQYLRGRKEAGLLIIPLLLINMNDMLNAVQELLFEFGLRGNLANFIPPFTIGEIPVYLGQIEGFLFVLSIAALLLYRFHRTSQERARAQSELEAARSMQEVMVPKRLHVVGGFSVDSAYIPAQEVGGDFFQLHPCHDGSLLVVIGDVSGKGVKAAMLVSMIFGLLKRSFEITRSPAQILRDLNRCLMGQTDGKFATCCCALLKPDGTVIAANAGHLFPYCDGKEIELPCGLPLGTDADAEYDEVELHLPPGKRWLFISDGVVEARNKRGELYGFERTRSISIMAVNQIAQTAQEFGQEDDITVLGVERQAAVSAAYA